MEALYEAEFRFMNLVWENEPVNSTALTRICLDKLGWKKSTSYNMIKKLEKKGFLRNETATVSSLIARKDMERMESETIVESTFSGSLPAFVAAYLDGRKLSKLEAEELQRMIEEAQDE
jgi:predicted transcriptional regulator